MASEKHIPQLRGLLGMLMPNKVSLGYGLFLAINAASVWGGVFPFLPMEFQTHDIVFWFFLAQSLIFFLSFFVSMTGVYFFPKPTRYFIVRLAVTPYLLGWVFLISAIYFDDFAIYLVTAAGALLGLGSAGFYMLWQRIFASMDSDDGNHNLILGTAYGTIFYFLLYLIPVAVTAFLIPLVFLPLFGLAIVLTSRTIDPEQPMFEDIPREHPRVYQSLVRDYWRSALCVGALGICTGIMRSLAIADPRIGSLVNVLSMGTTLIAALVLLILWQVKDIRINVVSAYRFFFPFIITTFFLLPFMGVTYNQWLAAGLYAVYSIAIMLMMIQCAQASRDRGVNPVFIYGFFGGIVYGLHDVGFFGGTFVENATLMGITPLALVAMVAIYLLGLMYFISYGGFKRVLRSGLAKSYNEASNVELLARKAGEDEGPKAIEVGAGERAEAGEAPHAFEETTLEEMTFEDRVSGAVNEGYVTETDVAKASNSKAPISKTDEIEEREQTYEHQTYEHQTYEHERGHLSGNNAFYQDRLSKQAALVRRAYRLSARETEVMELIARGNTVARIAEQLIVSENTIRTHSKRIYAKLDIHKRQELLELIESFDPKDLGD